MDEEGRIPCVMAFNFLHSHYRSSKFALYILLQTHIIVYIYMDSQNIRTHTTIYTFGHVTPHHIYVCMLVPNTCVLLVPVLTRLPILVYPDWTSFKINCDSSALPRSHPTDKLERNLAHGNINDKWKETAIGKEQQGCNDFIMKGFD